MASSRTGAKIVEAGMEGGRRNQTNVSRRPRQEVVRPLCIHPKSKLEKAKVYTFSPKKRELVTVGMFVQEYVLGSSYSYYPVS